MTRRADDTIVKDPSSIEPQGFDWTDYLAELGAAVTIATSTWSVTGPDALLTLSSDSILVGNLRTQVYLTAGTLGGTYTITNRIITNSSPAVQDERSFHVVVQQR